MSTASNEIKLPQPLIDKLIKQAKRTCWDDNDDFNPYDWGGGNFDDTYSGGCEDGETHLARDILNELGISYD